MKDTAKACRGQIWYANADHHYQGDPTNNPYFTKCRPYLIVSSNQGNFSSPDVIGLPIASNTSNLKSVNVTLMMDNKLCKICCSTPTPISKDQLENYVSTVSDFIMDEVESSMMIALGMSDRWVLRDKQVKELGELISEYKKIQNLISAMKQNNIDSFSDITSEFIRSLSDTLPKSVEVPHPDDSAKKKRIKWNKEICEQFIDDYENNSKEAMRDYYGISSVETAYYNAKKKLKELCENEE